jgi:hypothetical protein
VVAFSAGGDGAVIPHLASSPTVSRGRPHREGDRRASECAVDVDAALRLPRGPHTDARLRGDARGRDGGVR